jgi:acetoin utilization deacetylase AcuC-like enzyme
MSVHVVWHPSCLKHSGGLGHPESPTRLEAILSELKAPATETAITWHEAQPVDRKLLTAVHAAAYVDRVRDLSSGGGGRLDADTAVNEHSYDAALRGAGAAVEAAGHALSGAAAFAAVRPPGHHATADRAMGFCLFNNVVLAARWATETQGVERVLIVDWDVHHGNGTQALVEHDAHIRYVSLHQWPLYPGTGREDERGVGNVFNLPRPPGLPRERYLSDLKDGVARATDGWTPELLLISAGFDAMAGDPLAGFTLEPEDYAHWVVEWRQLGVPIASVLEGGYAPDRISKAAAAHLAALA